MSTVTGKTKKDTASSSKKIKLVKTTDGTAAVKVLQISSKQIKQIQDVAIIGALEAVHDHSVTNKLKQYMLMNKAYHGDPKDANSVGMILQLINGTDRFSKLYAENGTNLNPELLLSSMAMITKEYFHIRQGDHHIMSLSSFGLNAKDLENKALRRRGEDCLKNLRKYLAYYKQSKKVTYFHPS